MIHELVGYGDSCCRHKWGVKGWCAREMRRKEENMKAKKSKAKHVSFNLPISFTLVSCLPFRCSLLIIILILSLFPFSSLQYAIPLTTKSSP